jgi:5-oxoprolinase (ATP-hydrolysing) subunit C
MSAMLEAVDGGMAVTVQDRGRPGYRNIGVPVSGALDPVYLAAANALLGNEPGAAGLEVIVSGPSLKVLRGEVRVALIGAVSAKVHCERGRRFQVEPQTTATLFPGDVIRIGRPASGVSYAAFSGGVEVEPALGSRSTYLRAGLGGLNGRALATGDRLPCGVLRGDPFLEAKNPQVLVHEDGPIRVILGPQDDHFTKEAIDNFLNGEFIVTRDMDRMGIRLDGIRLEHNEKGSEIISDGVVPGSIQVPAGGHPIVLLADCQTSGGYPKIATVIQSDLPRLAHVRPGMALRFRGVSIEEAAAVRRAQSGRLRSWIANIAPFRPPGGIDEEALLCCNLISGAVRGDEFYESAI